MRSSRRQRGGCRRAPLVCGGCDDQPTFAEPLHDHATQLYDILDELSPAVALEVINAVTVAVERPDLTQLRHLLLEDPDVCYEILQAVQSILTMPEDACGWWGHAAAQHVCTNKLTCLAGLARSSPEWLDEQRAIILSAHEGHAEAKAERALVPERAKPSKLQHREGDTRTRSELQAQAAAASSELRAASASEAVLTPKAAAEQVRLALMARGCCVQGAAALCKVLLPCQYRPCG